MTKRGKKLIAVIMAGVMMCAPAMASATEVATMGAITADTASGSSISTGGMAGYADPDVFSVELPVTQNEIYHFTLDPQQLLKTSGQTGYTEDATLWFDNKSATSSALTAVNKGNVPVKVSVSAEVSKLTGAAVTADASPVAISLTEDKTFANDKTASMYLGVKIASNPAVALDKTTQKATASYTLPALDQDNFELVSGSGVFKWKLKDDVTEFEEVKFALEGACNKAADWKEYVNVAPELKVVWNLEKAETTETTPQPLTVTKTSNNAIDVTTFAEVKSAKLVKFNGKANTTAMTKGTHYTVSGKTLTLLSSWTSLVTAETVITLTFDDGQTQTLTVKVN